MNTFDRLKIGIPHNCFGTVDITNTSVHEITHDGSTKVDEIYYQFRDLPDGVTDLRYHPSAGLVLDFSGKILKERYPELVSIRNIDLALQNAIGHITEFDLERVLEESSVYIAHVTKDIKVDGTVADEMAPLQYIHHPKFIQSRYESGLSFSSKNKKNRIRIKMYDKAKEMRRQYAFLKRYGKERILGAFENTMRVELEIYHMSRFREVFQSKETPMALIDVLQCPLDIIADFMDQMVLAMDSEELPDIPDGKIAEVEKELGKRELIRYFDYDYSSIRYFINSRNKGNNSPRLKTYRVLTGKLLTMRLRKNYSAEAVDRITEIRKMFK